MEISPKQLAAQLKTIYDSDPGQAEGSIEKFLENITGDLSSGERVAFVEGLSEEFFPPSNRTDQEVLLKVISLMLGKTLAAGDLSSPEILERVSNSFNTLFDSLNQLVGVMNTALLGQSNTEETIRTVIGFHIQGEDRLQALAEYIRGIQRTFLLTHKAFKQAAGNIVEIILKEFDPEKIAAETKGMMKIGPLKKAEMFDSLEEKIKTCKKWFESERFNEDLIREFEKQCRELISDKEEGK